MKIAKLSVVAPAKFKIEKDVPLPDTGRGRIPKYPFADMEIGDSFLVSQDQTELVRNAVYGFGLRHNKKFSVRKVADGCRCWRVS